VVLRTIILFGPTNRTTQQALSAPRGNRRGKDEYIIAGVAALPGVQRVKALAEEKRANLLGESERARKLLAGDSARNRPQIFKKREKNEKKCSSSLHHAPKRPKKRKFSSSLLCQTLLHCTSPERMYADVC
jgi:hypothetical protein